VLLLAAALLPPVPVLAVVLAPVPLPVGVPELALEEHAAAAPTMKSSVASLGTAEAIGDPEEVRTQGSDMEPVRGDVRCIEDKVVMAGLMSDMCEMASKP